MTNRENSRIIAGFCILIVLTVFLSACITRNSGTNAEINSQDNLLTGAEYEPKGPVSLTINSAEKLKSLNNLSPLDGGYFLVLNISVKNHDFDEGFDLTNTSITLFNNDTGELIPASINANPRIRNELSSSLIPLKKIGHHETVTGHVIFGVADSSGYLLNLIDADKSVITSLPVSFRNQTPLTYPVTLTINSARKLVRANEAGQHTRDGTMFVVLDITVKNNDVREGFDFTNTSTTLLNPEKGMIVTRSSNFIEKMEHPPEHLINFPTRIAPGESITGQIVFRVYDSVRYRLNLAGPDKNVLTSRQVNFENLTTTEHPVSVTVHSVEKKLTLNDIRTGTGEVFVLINVTLKNNDLPDGFYFYQGSTTLRDLVSGRNLGFSFNEKKDYGQHGVEGAFVLPRKIQQNESITGKLVFATVDSDKYLLNFVDHDDTVLVSRTVNAG